VHRARCELEALANAAALLGSRLPRVRDPAVGLRMAHGMETLLRNLSIGCGALDVALGEGLDALTVGRRAMDLKYSNIADYAREELGINASTAVEDGAAGAEAPGAAAVARGGAAGRAERPQGGDCRAGRGGR